MGRGWLEGSVVLMCGWGYGWMWVWPVFVVAGLVFLVYGVVRLAQSRSPAPGGPGSSAQRILDERLARGEIDEDEYRRRRAELQ
jgi:putative membrane protein